MEYKYTLNILDDEGSIKTYVLTNSDHISIGSGLYCHVRVQLPSIEEVHLKIYVDQGQIMAFGKDVRLNDEVLEMGKKYNFDMGDIVRIHGKGFQVKMTDPNTVIDQAKIFKECPEHLRYLTRRPADFSFIEIENDLFINGRIEKENKLLVNKKMSEGNEQGKKINNLDDNEMEVIEEAGSTINGEEQFINETREEVAMRPMSENEQAMEIIEEEIVDEKVEMEVTGDESINQGNDVVKNVLIENNEIVTNEVCGDLHTKKETNITREVVRSHYIKEGVIYQEVKEKVNIEEIQETKLEEANTEEDVKTNFEVQAAVKIIDASSSETKTEDALEEGDLSSVKNAIISKQEDLNEEIKESIDSSVVVDTPINPLISKKVSRDLGDAVIEKEILKDAERAVEEQLNQNSEQSLNLTKMIKEVEKEDETKDSVTNPFFDLSGEDISKVTTEENFELKESVLEKITTEEISEKESIPMIEEQDSRKVSDLEELIPVRKEALALKEKEVKKVDDQEALVPVKEETTKDEEAPALEEKEVKKVDDQEALVPAKKDTVEESSALALKEKEVKKVDDQEALVLSKDEQDINKVEKSMEAKKEKSDTKAKVSPVNDKFESSKKKVSPKKIKQEESDKQKKPKESSDKKEGVGYDSLTILKDKQPAKLKESNENSKYKEEGSTKHKPISKLTVTPRSTRKASMVSHAPPVISAPPKRVKRNASSSSSSDSKKSADASTKRSKSKK
jgi:hypothetical protein